MHVVTNLQFVDAGREEVPELLPVLYQGMKRSCCSAACACGLRQRKTCEQLGLGFVKCPKNV